MKVNLINCYNLNRTSLNNAQTQTGQIGNSATDLTRPSLGYISYPIAFGAGKLAFLNIRDIPCPCCGNKMVTPNDFNGILSAKNLSKPIKESLVSLLPFQKNMPTIERLCFEQIKKAAKVTPEKSLQDILMILRPASLKKLKTHQFKVLSEIDNLGTELSLDSKMELTNLTNKSRAIITENDIDKPFQRKTFLKEVTFFIKDYIPETIIGDKILEHARTLKRANNDLDAFIVKYSARTSKEIGQRLICKAVATIEHLRAKNPKYGEGGSNEVKNLVAECLECNNDRSNTPLREWVETHPEMRKNSQLYIDKIIDLINKGKVKDYAHYPRLVANTLKVESGGLINLDISRLEQKPLSAKARNEAIMNSLKKANGTNNRNSLSQDVGMTRMA